MHRRLDRDRQHGAVDRALFQCGQYVAECHRHRRAAEPLDHLLLHVRGQDPKLLALEVGQMADGIAGDDVGRLRDEQGGTVDAFVGAETEIIFCSSGFFTARTSCGRSVMRPGAESTSSAFVDADQELGRADIALDRAELHTLDLARIGPSWLAG